MLLLIIRQYGDLESVYYRKALCFCTLLCLSICFISGFWCCLWGMMMFQWTLKMGGICFAYDVSFHCVFTLYILVACSFTVCSPCTSPCTMDFIVRYYIFELKKMYICDCYRRVLLVQICKKEPEGVKSLYHVPVCLNKVCINILL